MGANMKGTVCRLRAAPTHPARPSCPWQRTCRASATSSAARRVAWPSPRAPALPPVSRYLCTQTH